MADQIRLATVHDIAHLEDIEKAADAMLIEVLEPDSWEAATAGRLRAAQPGFILVVTEHREEAPVGFAHVLEIGGHAHLEQLAVLPEHGRRGHGRALVDGVKVEAARRGNRQITLRTYANIPWNAPFYARCGFVETEPDDPFLCDLQEAEERAGLERYGRRIQMTAVLDPRG